MEAQKLRVGLIGTGVAIRTYLPGFRTTGEAEVIGISGSSYERAQAVAQDCEIPIAYRSYRELCGDDSIDLICVTSPNAFHLEHYAAAVATGKHVIMEKPVASTSAELRQFLELPMGERQVVIVNHQLRFNPYFRLIKQIAREGLLGKPYYVRIHQQEDGSFSPATPFSWSFDGSRGGGVRLAIGSHLVDLLRTFFGDVPAGRVLGTMDVVMPKRRDRDGNERDVTASSSFASLLTMDSATALVSASSAAAAEERFDIDILGDNGEAHFDLDTKLRVYTSNGRYAYTEPTDVLPEELTNEYSIFRSSFVYLARALVRALLHEDPAALAPAARVGDSVATTGILDAISESAQRGEAVHLSPEARTLILS